MAYRILKEIYSQVKEKLVSFGDYISTKNKDYIHEEEFTKARIAVLMGRCVEDLPELNCKKNLDLEGKVKSTL